MRTVASTNAGSGLRPLIGKFCTARSVCTPYSASLGTSRAPSGSFSLRVLSLIEIFLWRLSPHDAGGSIQKGVRSTFFRDRRLDAVTRIYDGVAWQRGDF